ncbi:MAG TPA: ABC transporter permease [Propionibacteriaceae bacterium]|nr:ABC transporter permease [Propionibacteriaceae bacterium]
MTGWRGLVRLAWRRDRIMIGVVLLCIWLLSYYSAVAVPTLYSSRDELVAANAAANASTGVVAMYGHIYNTASVGGVAANKVAMLDFITLAFLVIAVVRRHTRAEEESGRFELLGATPVGRLAPLGAAMVLAVATSVVAGVVTIPAVIAGGWPVGGSVLFGLAQTGVGLSFAALTAIAVQLSSSYRACGAWIFGALGVTFVLRMIGDVSWDRPARVVTWFSPLGWAQQVRYYDGDRAWPLLPPVALLVLGTLVAGWLQSRRDLGAGLLADRRGPATGRLATPLGLAWRLQRAGLVGWLVTYLILGALFGAIVDTIGGLMSGGASDLLRKLGGVGTFNDIYLTLVGVMGAFGAAAFGITAVLRLRSEESSGHLESVLATPVTRLRFLASHAAVAFAGSTVLLAVLGLTMAAAHRTGSSGYWREASPAFAHLPAVWVMVAAALVAVAWLPRLDWLGWALLAGVVLLGELGPLMKLPDWVQKVSPFAHTPKIPVEAMAWTPEAVLTVLALALVAAALVGYRRRGMPVA